MRLKVSNVCQLLDKSKYPATQTVNGVTFTNNGDGTITANGTVTTAGGIATVWISSINLIKGNKYIIAGGPKGGNNKKWSIMGQIYTDDGKWIVNVFDLGSGQTFVAPSEESTYLSVYLQFWASTSDLIYKPQLFDLTEMYGAGNEPTTVEQFRQDFPNEMYDYSPECWKKFRRLKYVAETKNLLDYNKFSPIWKTNSIISDSGYLSKPTSTFNTSLFYIVSGYSATLPDVSNLLQLKGTYTFSISSISIGDIYIMKYNADGTMNKQIGSLTNIKKVETLTFDELTYVDIKIQKETAVIVTGLMVQEGSTATPYQPYGYLPLNRGKYIANKEPVQLLDKSEFKKVVSKNVTSTPNTTNGMWTISGAATASEYLAIGSYRPGTNFDIGDKLFLRNSNIDNSVYFPYAAWYDKDNKYLGEYDGMGVFSVTNPKTAYIACYFTTRTVGDINVTTQVQLFNLTRMHGKGNEPTAAEFVAQYPGFDYPVNKHNAITFR